jgi:hypothetical protein
MGKTFAFSAVVISLSLGTGWLISCGSSEYSDLVKKCKEVRLGSPESHVLKELGPPARTHGVELHGRQVRILMYPAPSLASTAPDIYIDEKSRVVVRVVCDDEYTLVEKK